MRLSRESFPKLAIFIGGDVPEIMVEFDAIAALYACIYEIQHGFNPEITVDMSGGYFK